MAPQSTLGFLSLSVYVILTSANRFRKEAKTRPAYRQELRNEGDTQYTGVIKLGGQEIEVVPDTGSFEMVMLSDKCSTCGDSKKLYHASDPTYEEGSLQAEQNYGSGSTDSIEAYDNVALGHFKVEHQMFWKVYQANMPLLQYSSFQGIFGMGPPASNALMAADDVQKVKSEIDKMKEGGDDVTQYEPIVKQYEDVAEFSKTVKLWLEQAKMTHFSVCLGKAKGSSGVVVYNDDTDQSLFSKKVKVVGDMYWGFKLHNVVVPGLGTNKHGDDKALLDCGDNACDVILDTGTSLIAAPQAALDRLVEALDRYSNVGGGCSDLSGLPDLEFKIGNEQFSLPPEAYVGEIDSDHTDWAVAHMPHLQGLKDKHDALLREGKPGGDRWCVPLIMSMGDEQMWILGMPFFRKYYTLFRLSDDSQDGREAWFAEFGKDCQLGAQDLRGELAEPRGIPMLVDPTKLLPPKRARISGQSVGERFARITTNVTLGSVM